MDQPGLHGRHRDKNGQISKKHGNTLIGTLHKVYGSGFAKASRTMTRCQKRWPRSTSIP